MESRRPSPPDLEGTATVTLRRVAPAWYWLRANFSLASVLTIAGIISVAGGYIIHLQTRVTIVERDVLTIKEIVPNATAVADLKERVDRLEKNWDDARQSAGEAPYPTHRGKQR